jgi:hypothetical protein
MIIEPTVAEVATYIVLAVIGLIGLGLVFLPWNDRYSRKDDPYKYCPKDED